MGVAHKLLFDHGGELRLGEEQVVEPVVAFLQVPVHMPKLPKGTVIGAETRSGGLGFPTTDRDGRHPGAVVTGSAATKQREGILDLRGTRPLKSRETPWWR